MMLVAALLVAAASASSAKSPNVLFILTDDQDVMLGSFDADGPMQETRKRILEEGVWFENSFCHVPICCPSRASLITGRYMHNNGATDNGCGGKAFQDGAEQHNFFTFAKTAGYTTYYAGKYLNNYGKLGGIERVPPGFDSWYGLQGNSKYYGYTVSNNGVAEKHGNDYHKDYYTDRLANRSLEFLRNISDGIPGFSEPFVMMIGTPASHGPNDPAPQYQTAYANKLAPRTPSWNLAPQPEKHPLMQGIVKMDQGHIDTSDVFFERRWSVLKSVDDMVVRLMDELEQMGALDNTFIIFSADNGFHLGQFGMLYDKRMLYEHDIRIPLAVRGPGIRKNVTSAAPVMHHDLAPTILQMMGIEETPEIMDGSSWLPQVLESGKPKTWRTDFLVEYNGPKISTKAFLPDAERQVANNVHDQEAVEAATQSETSCTANTSAETLNCKCSCRYKNTDGSVYDRSPCDSKENTYKCLRTINSTEDSNYCEFDDGYVEYYNTKKDPWGLVNLAVKGRTANWKLDALSRRLYAHMLCKGASCFDPPAAPPAPSPPPSMRFTKGSGLCLQVANDDNNKPSVVVGDCSVHAGWENFTNSAGYDMIRNVDTQSCVNDNGVTCQAQNPVHAFQKCDGTPKWKGAGNRFIWDGTRGQLKHGQCTGFCLGAAASLGAVAELVHCKNESFATWAMAADQSSLSQFVV